MRLHKPTIRRESMMNIAPLIDVVFLLIIFMAVVSHITRLDIEELRLPRASQGRLEESQHQGRIVINIHQDGRIVSGGIEQTTESLDSLLLKTVQDRSDHNVSVVIRSDRQTPWRSVAEVLRQCRKQGLTQLKVAVIQGGAGRSADASAVQGGG